ncbi:hypothetical protein ACFX1Z_004438 [Malus domestica]
MSAKSSTTVLSTPHSRLIINFFSTSALPIAKELHLPTYYFYTSGHPNVQPMLDRDRPAYWDDMLYLCSHLLKSDGIIDNTFEEVEPTSTLKGYSSRSRIILADSTEGDSKRVGDKWDGKRFLWVVKKPPADVKTKQLHGVDNDFDLEGLLPEGFLERTNDRGMVVLEAVVSGVPLIDWPLYAEQHLDRNNLVKDMEIATGVEQREEDGFLSGDELERKVRELMESEGGRALRERSKQMQRWQWLLWERLVRRLET